MLGAIVFGFSGEASANPLQFNAGAKTATATTTLTYMTPGTATSTTLVYDSYEIDGKNQTNQYNTWVPDKAHLLLQVNASSTASVFRVDLEYSNGTNCQTTPSACDWYGDGMFATTTNPVSLNAKEYLQWTFASSTIGGVPTSTGLTGASVTNNRDNRIIEIPVPLRFVRAVISVTGANGAVYAEIQPLKQVAR